MRNLLPALVFLSAAAPALAAHVPFVGCHSDGQLGPQPVPKAKATPDLPSAAAAKLAYYVGPYGAVLAPRGWHCFQTYGSNGQTLFVAPHPIPGIGKIHLDGSAVLLGFSYGGTSGRFDVAETAARLFPVAKSFVDSVEAEGIIDKPFVRQPYPADRITHRGPYEALVTTPADAEGIGTSSRLPRGPLPIDNVLMLIDPKGEMNLVHLAARLAPAQRPLVAYIIAQVKKER